MLYFVGTQQDGPKVLKEDSYGMIIYCYKEFDETSTDRSSSKSRESPSGEHPDGPLELRAHWSH